MNRTATTFLALPVAGGLHQDPSHHLRRDSEEVRAIPPFDAIDVDQPQYVLRSPVTSPAAYDRAAPGAYSAVRDGGALHRPAGPVGRGRIRRPGSTLGEARWVRCRNSAT